MIRCTPTIIMLHCLLCHSDNRRLFGANLIYEIVHAVITLTMYADRIYRITSEQLCSGRKGQESFACVGNRRQAFIRIIFPQMMYIAVPMISNVIISLIRDTATMFAISLVDLMGQAKILDSLAYNVHTTRYIF